MKKILVAMAGLVFIIIAMACQNMRDEAQVDRGGDFQGGQSIIINDGRLSLEIRYAGKFILNDDETGISNISPDGFIRFKKNDIALTAEPGKEGQVIYNFSEKSRKVSDERGKKILAESMREMIANGVFANERAERLYRKGGAGAVLNALNGLKTDAAKAFYFNYLFGNSVLTANEITDVVIRMGAIIYSDMTKGDLLNKIPALHLKNPETVKAYLMVANGIKDNMSKGNGLRNISERQLTDEQFDQLMLVAGSISHDMEKGSVLKRLIDEKQRTEAQWISLINEVGRINSSMEKSEVLSQIAQKMPAGEKIRVAYVNNAKTLKGLDYEKAMKALR